MSQSRMVRMGAVAGILFVALMYAGVFLGDTTLIKSLPEPSMDASGVERAAYLAGTHQAQLVKAYLVVFAGIFLLVFLRVVARTLSDTTTNPTVVHLGASLGSAATGFTMAGGGILIPTLLAAGRGVDAGEARILNDASYALYILSWLALSAYLAVLAVGSIGHMGVSAWLRWPAVLTSAVLLLMGIAFATFEWVWLLYGVFALWTVGTSLSMLMRSSAGVLAPRIEPSP